MELEEVGEHLAWGRNFPPPREAEERRDGAVCKSCWQEITGVQGGRNKLASFKVSRGGTEEVEES